MAGCVSSVENSTHDTSRTRSPLRERRCKPQTVGVAHPVIHLSHLGSPAQPNITMLSATNPRMTNDSMRASPRIIGVKTLSAADGLRQMPS